MAYSYGAVGTAIGLGMLGPDWAGAVLGPVLLAGLVGLGMAHGACDQLVLPAHHHLRGPRWRYLLRFGMGYLALAGAVGVGWWQWPTATVGLFFGLTAWHWGSADAPAHPRRSVWLAHSLLRGALLFAVPAWAWPAETAQHVQGLLALAGAAPATGFWVGSSIGAVALALVLAGHLGLWAVLARQQAVGRAHRDAQEVLLLGGLCAALPPLLALGVYFVFWHSLQHVLRLTPLLGYAAGPGRTWTALGRELVFFSRRALPVLLVSGGALAGAYALGRAWLPAQDAWLGLAVLAASVVTLPHALLVSVVMDAPKWRPGPRLAVPASPLPARA